MDMLNAILLGLKTREMNSLKAHNEPLELVPNSHGELPDPAIMPFTFGDLLLSDGEIDVVPIARADDDDGAGNDARGDDGARPLANAREKWTVARSVVALSFYGGENIDLGFRGNIDDVKDDDHEMNTANGARGLSLAVARILGISSGQILAAEQELGRRA